MGKSTEQKESADASKATEDVSKKEDASAPQEGKLDLSMEVDVGGEKMLLAEALEAAQRGRGLDKVQSLNAQLKAQLEKETSEKAELAQRLQQIEKEQEKQQILDELMSVSGLKKQEKDTDDWLTEDESSKFDPDKFSRQMETTIDKLLDAKFGNIDSIVEQRLATQQAKQQAEREQNEAIRIALNSTRSTEESRLKEDLGLDDATVEKILTLQEAVYAKQEEAKSYARSGDMKAFNEAWTQATSYSRTADDMRVKAIAEKQQADRQREFEQQLETGQFLKTDEMPKPPEKKKRSWKRKDIESRKESIKQLVTEQAEAAIQAARANGIELTEQQVKNIRARTLQKVAAEYGY